MADLAHLEHRIAVLADAWDFDRAADEAHRRFVEALQRRRDFLQPALLELHSEAWAV